MDERERLRQERLLAEEYGLLFEEMGRTRMDGRIVAWLLVADPPVQSLSQIAEALGVSKAAVSTAARSLLQLRMVERVSEPGRRGDFYRSLLGDPEGVLQVDHIERLTRLVDRSLALTSDKDQTQSNCEVLHELRDFLAFLHTEIPGLMDRWQARRTAQRGRSARSDGITEPTDSGGAP